MWLAVIESASIFLGKNYQNLYLCRYSYSVSKVSFWNIISNDLGQEAANATGSYFNLLQRELTNYFNKLQLGAKCEALPG